MSSVADVARASSAGAGHGARRLRRRERGRPRAEPLAEVKPAAAAPTYDAVPLIPREVLFGNPSKVAPALSPRRRPAGLPGAPRGGAQRVRQEHRPGRRPGGDRRPAARHPPVPAGPRTASRSSTCRTRAATRTGTCTSSRPAGGEARDLTPMPKVQAQIIAVERRPPQRHPDRPQRPGPAAARRLPGEPARRGSATLVYQNDIGAVGFVADHRLHVRVAQVLNPDGGARLLHRRGNSGSLERAGQLGGGGHVHHQPGRLRRRRPDALPAQQRRQQHQSSCAPSTAHGGKERTLASRPHRRRHRAARKPRHPPDRRGRVHPRPPGVEGARPAAGRGLRRRSASWATAIGRWSARTTATGPGWCASTTTTGRPTTTRTIAGASRGTSCSPAAPSWTSWSWRRCSR